MHYKYAAMIVAAVSFSQAAPIVAQTVQLPTHRVYSTNSSVLVPDGGAAYLSGNSTVRSGSNRTSVPFLGRLPIAGRAFQNRATGQDQYHTDSWVTAKIIDHREWDEAVLAEARRQRIGTASERKGATKNETLEAEALFLSSNMSRRPTSSFAAELPRAQTSSTPSAPHQRHLAPLHLGTNSPTNR